MDSRPNDGRNNDHQGDDEAIEEAMETADTNLSGISAQSSESRKSNNSSDDTATCNGSADSVEVGTDPKETGSSVSGSATQH